MIGSLYQWLRWQSDQGTTSCLKFECKTLPGVYIVWCRNCPHENQATLVLKRNLNAWRQTSDAAGWILNTFRFVWNCSSESYDLLIMNTTDSDEGLYYALHKILESGCRRFLHLPTIFSPDSNRNSALVHCCPMKISVFHQKIVILLFHFNINMHLFMVIYGFGGC